LLGPRSTFVQSPWARPRPASIGSAGTEIPARTHGPRSRQATPSSTKTKKHSRPLRRNAAGVAAYAAATEVASSSPEAALPDTSDLPAPGLTALGAGPDALVKDADFAISKVSFGSILTPVGSALLVYGFGAFFQLLPGADLSSVMLIYGFPICVLGFALSYAQLDPVPCLTTKAAFDLRGRDSTDIQRQIREDVTRYRYGDEQHLEEALDKVFKIGRPGGVPRRQCPRLTGLREEMAPAAPGGAPAYALVLEFEGLLDPAGWQERRDKIQAFFGPGVVARVAVGPAQPPTPGVRAAKDERAGMRRAEVYLVTDGSGEGRTGGGGDSRPDALPPLMPGFKARTKQ
jgi:hypothetical protein